jgi:hypothetical protein
MRNASGRLETPSQHLHRYLHRQAHVEQVLPALQKTSRYRFHEDEGEASDSVRTARRHGPDPDVEDES